LAARPAGVSHERTVAGLDDVVQGQSIALTIMDVFGISAAVFSFNAARIWLDLI
jgi:hypothetical protein